MARSADTDEVVVTFPKCMSVRKAAKRKRFMNVQAWLRELVRRDIEADEKHRGAK